MTPTIVMKNGEPYLLTGSPGGSRIITTVLQVILNVLDFHLNIAEATNAERVHHQWFPDEMVVEKGLNQDTIGILHSLGHKVVVGDTIGSAQSIMKIGDFFYGASDPRTPGSQALGY
jgi:gamma-glutamyltranspeptidase/glutathione hydrolase